MVVERVVVSELVVVVGRGDARARCLRAARRRLAVVVEKGEAVEKVEAVGRETWMSSTTWERIFPWPTIPTIFPRSPGPPLGPL